VKINQNDLYPRNYGAQERRIGCVGAIEKGKYRALVAKEKRPVEL